MRMLQGVWGVALSSVLFAAMAVLARVASRQMGTGELCVIRLGIGAAVMLASFVLRRRPPITRTPLLLAGRGVFGGFAAVLYFLAIRHLETGPATLLNNLAPCFAALFAALFLGERPRWSTLGGLLVATVGGGVVIASTVPAGQGFHFGFGALCAIASAVLTGAALTTIRALRTSGTDASSVFFSFSLIGALLASPLAVADWHPVPGAVMACAIAVGLVSVLAQLLLTDALKFVTTARGSAISQLTSVFSWVLALACLGESITALAFAGAALCVGGVLLAARPPALRAQVASPRGQGLLGPAAGLDLSLRP